METVPNATAKLGGASLPPAALATTKAAAPAIKPLPLDTITSAGKKEEKAAECCCLLACCGAIVNAIFSFFSCLYSLCFGEKKPQEVELKEKPKPVTPPPAEPAVGDVDGKEEVREGDDLGEGDVTDLDAEGETGAPTGETPKAASAEGPAPTGDESVKTPGTDATGEAAPTDKDPAAETSEGEKPVEASQAEPAETAPAEEAKEKEAADAGSTATAKPVEITTQTTGTSTSDTAPAKPADPVAVAV